MANYHKYIKKIQHLEIPFDSDYLYIKINKRINKTFQTKIKFVFASIICLILLSSTLLFNASQFIGSQPLLHNYLFQNEKMKGDLVTDYIFTN